MPANLTPQYYNAEREFRAAKTRDEKIACLENMLALIPKHKGTDHMQADLKRRLSRLRKEGEKERRVKRTPVFRVEREGAGQFILLGAPNAGKSQLLAALTKARPAVAEYPFTTHVPQPGMLSFEDVQIQLVDGPAITSDYLEPWMPDLIRRADAALLVADLADDGVLDAVEAVLRRLAPLKIQLCREVPADAPMHMRAFWRAVILANKLDLAGAPERLDLVREYFADRFDIWPVSALMGTGLDVLPRRLFDFLRIIRVYTKEPGKKPDLKQPYTLPAGSTVLDLAKGVHREFEDTLRSARLWGSGKYEGIRVKRDHVLSDRDIVELHE